MEAQRVRFCTRRCCGLHSRCQQKGHHLLHHLLLAGVVPPCSPNFSRWIKPDKVQTHIPSASFVMVALGFGTGASETEGMLTPEVTESLHPPEISLWKPSVELIRVSAVLIKLVPVVSLLRKVYGDASPVAAPGSTGGSQFLYDSSFWGLLWHPCAGNI